MNDLVQLQEERFTHSKTKLETVKSTKGVRPEWIERGEEVDGKDKESLYCPSNDVKKEGQKAPVLR